jgi:hypothetical protein
VLQELQQRGLSESRLQLLDVGAIKARYQSQQHWRVTSIDLLSQDDAVEEIDFFDFAKRDTKVCCVCVLLMSERGCLKHLRFCAIVRLLADGDSDGRVKQRKKRKKKERKKEDESCSLS